MRQVVLDTGGHGFLSCDFCLFSLVINVTQWLSYSVLA